MTLKAFGAELTASGKTVVLIICALAIITYGFWHENMSADRTSSIIAMERQIGADVMYEQRVTTSALEVMACILTLTEPERREFRHNGRYCGGSTSAERVRERMTDIPQDPGASTPRSTQQQQTEQRQFEGHR